MRAKKPKKGSSGNPVQFLVHDFIVLDGTEYVATPHRFVSELTCTKLADDLIFNNFVNLSVSIPATQRTAIERIAEDSYKRFVIDSLPVFFNDDRFIRGRVYSNHVWKVIDEIARNKTNLYWWYSEEGLEMAALSQEELAAKIRIKRLSPFDKLAGRMFWEGMKQSRRVSDEAVVTIARALDAHGFKLKCYLKPSDWAPIRDYNQKFSRKAIRTFEDAFREFPRPIRRTFSEAKRNYEKAMVA